VGSAGQPKNANDRKTIRKAAMQAFRRRERIERIKAFAAECAAEAEATAAASPAAPPGGPSTVPTTTGDFSQPGTMALLKKSHFHTQYDTWREENPISDGNAFPSSTDRYHLTNTLFPPEIPLDLGYLNDTFCGDMPNVGYLFDYCTHTPLRFSPMMFYLIVTELVKLCPKSFLS
jgi:hypothetical protein